MLIRLVIAGDSFTGTPGTHMFCNLKMLDGVHGRLRHRLFVTRANFASQARQPNATLAKVRQRNVSQVEARQQTTEVGGGSFLAPVRACTCMRVHAYDLYY